MTNLHPISAAQLAAAQAIDPRNIDDAEYIAGHPRDFTPAEVKQAHRTIDAYYR